MKGIPMIRTDFTAYEGGENFIFVSYAHKNAEKVIPILDKLNAAGYRVWYDDGIAPGSEWPEYIAEHLNRCDVFLAFVSPESIASANCRREVTYALSKQKKFLGVLLEPTQMSPGMEMQLSAQQCIIRHNYRTEEEFLAKILGSSILLSCLRPVRHEVHEALPETPQPAEKRESGAQPVPRITDEDMRAVETMKQAGKPAKKADAKAQTPVRPQKDAAPAVPKKKKKVKWLIPAAACLVLAVIAAILLGSGLFNRSDTDASEPIGELRGGKLKISEKTTVKRTDTSVTLYNDTVTPASVEQLNKMEALTSFYMTNCTVEDDALAALKLPETVSTVAFENCSGIKSFGFLKDLPKLWTLRLTNCGANDTIPDLSGLEKLSEADLTGGEGFTDLSLLPLEKLTILRLGATGIKDLKGLEKAENLNTFSAAYTDIVSAEELTGLKRLIRLNLRGTKITGFKDPFSCLSLQYLYLSDTPLTDLEAFDAVTILKELDISGTGITKAPCLEKSCETVTLLYLSGLSLGGGLSDAVAKCKGIRELNLDGCTQTETLAFLKDLSELQTLYAAGCGLKDLKGLENKEKLQCLYVQDNEISEIPPLFKLADKAYLDLRGNSLSDIENLPALQYSFLGLCGNRAELSISDIPVQAGMKINALLIDYRPDFLEAPVVTNKAASYWYLVGTPADRQLKIGQTLGSGWVSFTTAEKLDAVIRAYGRNYYNWPDKELE